MNRLFNSENDVALLCTQFHRLLQKHNLSFQRPDLTEEREKGKDIDVWEGRKLTAGYCLKNWSTYLLFQCYLRMVLNA